MRPDIPLTLASVSGAAVANFIASAPVEKWAALAGILAGVLSAAVSLKNLLTKNK